jgi:hypothetical protein
MLYLVSLLEGTVVIVITCGFNNMLYLVSLDQGTVVRVIMLRLSYV